jgi:hypothetical protein
MHWHDELAYFVTPKWGPIRCMRTLADARRALIEDLPRALRKDARWLEAGWAVLRAADTGVSADIELATEAVVAAVAQQGWLTKPVFNCPDTDPNLPTYLAEIEKQLRSFREATAFRPAA